ncbi:GNAT family N-acetyltransferase [Aeromicrobium sp.]|uniref:GNAT family N-acetyltransferase n=1 Tax=Aeromicrobium sp. TaxID=1871063 RepID=UPI0019C92BD7|nr:GNAT family N-acetyltransferase [Aeromicrobium sp.]MBC7633899.1 GNAT family N-acetyltransferase [Aeromicrobium sp.]
MLRRLAIGDEEQITEAVAEFDAEGRQWSYRHRPDLAWPDYVALVNGWEQGHDLPDGFVTHADLVAEVDGVIVGRSSIRYELNDFLRAQGGHIGYAVRPHHRRRGHATQILRQSLEVLRARDVTPVLVTCDDTNVGSARVIETVGGILENVVPGEPGMPSKRRYWFT